MRVRYSAWDRVQSVSVALALIEQLAWKLEPGRQREEGFAVLGRVQRALMYELTGIISCLFDSATNAARLRAEALALKREDYGVAR